MSLASTLPACISEMRSQRSASFMKWVEMKMVTPCWRDNSTSKAQNWSRATGSTPLVGSSRIKQFQFHAPPPRPMTAAGELPGNAAAACPAYSVKAEALHQFGDAARAMASSKWNRRACRSRLAATVSSPYSEKACDM